MNNKTTLYQVDAFTDQLFHGNPAGVCVLKEWPKEEIMAHIAAENNLPETSFLVPVRNRYDIRWFTPTVEVALCGHATLASAHVLFHHLGVQQDTIQFYSPRSGNLSVERNGDWLTLNFPRDQYTKIEVPQELVRAFEKEPTEAYRGKTDFLLIFATQQEVESFNPDLELVASVGGRGVIVSAPGDGVDFVSRFFAPQSGITEDPVTGSAHTTLAPYWSGRTGKTTMTAQQLSRRRGDLTCELKNNRVLISGKAVTYLQGEISY